MKLLWRSHAMVFALWIYTCCMGRCNCIDTGELGDGFTSDQSRDGFFADMDNNANGQISLDELREFVKDTGGKSLDENSEIQNAVSSVFRNLGRENDMILKKNDLVVYWQSLASLLPTEEVAEWVTHSQLIPESIVARFIRNGITGYDFPELLENDGQLLEQELGITRITLKRRLLRGMRMKLLGMGRPPLITSPPQVVLIESSRCFTHVTVEWKIAEIDSNTNMYPVHKYLLQRLDVDPNSKPGSTSQHRWITVYDGIDTYTSDSIPLHSAHSLVSHTYRLSSWNVIGRSEYMYLNFELPLTGPATTSLSSKEISDRCGEIAVAQYMPMSMLKISTGLDVDKLTSNASRNTNRRSIHTPLQSAVAVSTPKDSSYSNSLKSSYTISLSSLKFISGISAVVTAGTVHVFKKSSDFAVAIYALLILGAVVAYSIYLRAMKKLNFCTELISDTHESVSSVFTWFHGFHVKPLLFLSPVLSISQQICAQSKWSFLAKVFGECSINSGMAPTRFSRNDSISSSAHSSCDEDASRHDLFDGEDSGNKHCFICKGKFKFKPHKIRWRKRHHCCKCLNAFCSRCGVVTHSPLLQCPVPGKCMCFRCAGMSPVQNTSIGQS